MTEWPPPKLPKLLVGTSWLGDVVPLPRSHRKQFDYLDQCVDLGLTGFDLAASYQAGGTERLFGRWLRSRGRRGELFLVSKGGHPLPLVAPHRLHPQALRADLESTMRRLGTDFIDLYLLHRDDDQPPLPQIVETMASFVQQGLVGGWGVSNWTHQRTREADEFAAQAGLPRPVATSPHFSLFEWTKPPWPGCVSVAGDSDALAAYRQAEIPLLAWSPLGSGFFGPGAPRSSYANARNLDRLGRAQQLAAERGCSPAEIGLAYVVSQPAQIHPVVASRDPERLRANFDALDRRLDASTVSWLESGSPERQP